MTTAPAKQIIEVGTGDVHYCAEDYHHHTADVFRLKANYPAEYAALLCVQRRKSPR